MKGTPVILQALQGPVLTYGLVCRYKMLVINPAIDYRYFLHNHRLRSQFQSVGTACVDDLPYIIRLLSGSGTEYGVKHTHTHFAN